MKPYLICHMVTTIDGRIIGKRWPALPAVANVRELFETTAASFKIPAWIVGTTTMKEFCAKPFKLPTPKGKIERTDFNAAAGAKSFAIGIDRRGQTFWKTNESDGDHVILILTQQVSDAYLAHLQKAGVSYIFAGKDDVSLPIAMDKLVKHFGIKKAMVQGGGKINGAFLKAGLLDEISHLTIPAVDGGQHVSTFFDIPGTAPAKGTALKVISHKTMPGGVMWVRYGVK